MDPVLKIFIYATAVAVILQNWTTGDLTAAQFQGLLGDPEAIVRLAYNRDPRLGNIS